MRKFTASLFFSLTVVAGAAQAQPYTAPVGGSPFPAGSGASAIAYSPNGHLAAVANTNVSTVGIYFVGADGALQLVNTAFPEQYPRDLVFTNDNFDLLAVCEGAQFVRNYVVEVDGTVNATGGAFVGAGARAIALAPDNVVYTANYLDNSLSILLYTGGGISPLADDFPVGNLPTDVAVSPDGSLLAVALAGDDEVKVFQRSGATLTLVSTGATQLRPTAVAFSPDGKLLVTADQLAGQLSVFHVDTGGALVAASAVPVGTSPSALAFDHSGSTLAVVDPQGDTLYQFAVSGSTLTPIAAVAIGNGPSGLAFSANLSKQTLAVADQSPGQIEVFARPGDTTPPVVTITTPANGAHYSVVLNLLFPVRASYGCSDAGSGVASCTGTAANGAVINTGLSALGTHSFSVTATDVAGNSKTVTSTYSVGLL